MIAWLLLGALFAECVHGVCEEFSEAVSLIQLRGQTKKPGEVTQYKDISGHDPQNPKLYCYAFLRVPLPAVTELLGRQLDQSCDEWDLFSSESNPGLRVTKLYEQPDFDHDWNFTMRGPVIAAWRHLLSKYNGNPFDWMIKLDYDSFVRPSTFRGLFLQYDTEKPLILSADDGTSDGYFAAVNSNAAQLFLPEVGMLGKKQIPISTVNCMIPLSGHSNNDRDTDYGDKKGHDCSERLGVKVKYPEDSTGQGLLITHFAEDPVELRCCQRPVLSREQIFEVAREGSRCFPTNTSSRCISTKFAVAHPIKEYADYAWLASRVV
jgi:hypothetical protein